MIAVDNRHPGGVVAAIFEPAQPIEQDGRRFRSADVTDDATHKLGRKRDTDLPVAKAQRSRANRSSARCLAQATLHVNGSLVKPRALLVART